MNLVLYLSASLNKAHPEAWGLHGYSYQEVAIRPKKIYDYFPTREGYLLRNEFSETTETIEPIDFFDFFYAGPSPTGFSQVNALIELSQFFKDRMFDQVLIHTDGRHLIHLLDNSIPKWKSNQWLDGHNQPIPHQDTLVSLDNYIQENHVNFRWSNGIKNFGDKIADLLYEIALNGSQDKQYLVFTAEEYRINEIDKHPFISTRRLIFSSGEHTDRGVYYLAESGIKGKKEEAFGKRLPDAAYAVIRINEPCEVIESIKTSHRVLTRGEVCPVVMKLDTVFDKTIYPMVDQYGLRALRQYNPRSNDLDFINKTSLTTELLPVGLSLNAIQNFNQLDALLSSYREISPQLKAHAPFKLMEGYGAIDITDYFYDTVIKKDRAIITLKSVYGVGSKLVTLDIDACIEDQTITLKIPLTMGLDLISRNNLKRIETLNPKIFLILHKESSLMYRYHCIIECDTGVGIWSNFFSNRVIAKPIVEQPT